MPNNNQIFYVEFQAADLAATKAFFIAAFDWKFTDYGPEYTSFEDGHMSGGFFQSEKRSTIAGGGPLVVLLHTQLEAALDRVVACGGKITQEIFAFPGGRRFHFIEPSGNELAVCCLG